MYIYKPFHLQLHKPASIFFLASACEKIIRAMSLSNLNQLSIPLESIPMNMIQLTILILGLVDFVMLFIILDSKKLYSFFSECQLSIQSQLSMFNDPNAPARENEDSEVSKKTVDGSVCEEDMEMVLRSLGISCNPEEGKLPARLKANDLLDVFEEKNPCLDEVKVAFDVFDKNKDGFIDARELQMVLCSLRLKEGSEIENCRKMIRVFDENGDGRVDFDEFVKLIECSFC